MIELAYLLASIAIAVAGFLVYIQHHLWFSEMWATRDQDIIIVLVVVCFVIAAVVAVASFPQLAIG